MNPLPLQQDPRIIVFGFGAQGSAQALNLRDSGMSVGVFLRPESPRIAPAREAGLLVLTDPQKAAQTADIAVVLLPDGEQPAFYGQLLHRWLPRGALVVFAHGFGIHYRLITPREDLDVALVAPMAQGETVRADFVAGRGVPCLLAVHQDATGKAIGRARAYARGISKTGPCIDTTFQEEVESDLFAEQAVLCGGLPELVRAAFDTLIDNGYQESIAYYSCLRELRAIVRIMDQHGITGMRRRISDTARYGALTRGRRVIDSSVRKHMRVLLEEIRSGAFTQELLADRQAGHPALREAEDRDREHPIEQAHKRLHSSHEPVGESANPEKQKASL